VPLPCCQAGLRDRRQDADQKPGIDRQLPAATKFTGKEERLIVGTQAKSVGMEGDRNEEVRNPLGGSAPPGSIEEAGEGAIESQTVAELEAMDSVAQPFFIKAGGDGPGKIRRMQEAFPADMIAAADGGKGKGTARATGGSEGENTVKTAGTEGGIEGFPAGSMTKEAKRGEEEIETAIHFSA